jgi:hypothetical protein
MALQPFAVLWPLLQFTNLFYTVGRAPWMRDQLFARPLPTHRINAHNTDIHAMSWFGTHDPTFERPKTVHALDCAATVIGPVALSRIYINESGAETRYTTL